MRVMSLFMLKLLPMENQSKVSIKKYKLNKNPKKLHKMMIMRIFLFHIWPRISWSKIKSQLILNHKNKNHNQKKKIKIKRIRSKMKLKNYQKKKRMLRHKQILRSGPSILLMNIYHQFPKKLKLEKFQLKNMKWLKRKKMKCYIKLLLRLKRNRKQKNQLRNKLKKKSIKLFFNKPQSSQIKLKILKQLLTQLRI